MIRKATHADIPAISGLQASKVPHFLNDDVSFSANSFEDMVQKFIAADGNDAVCLVSEVKGAVVAHILAYVIFHQTIGQIVGGEASWSAHAKHAGHGRIVLNAADAWFRQKGARRYFVACRSNDRRTARLLELIGFTPTERVFERCL